MILLDPDTEHQLLHNGVHIIFLVTRVDGVSSIQGSISSKRLRKLIFNSIKQIRLDGRWFWFLLKLSLIIYRKLLLEFWIILDIWIIFGLLNLPILNRAFISLLNSQQGSFPLFPIATIAFERSSWRHRFNFHSSSSSTSSFGRRAIFFIIRGKCPNCRHMKNRMVSLVESARRRRAGPLLRCLLLVFWEKGRVDVISDTKYAT